MQSSALATIFVPKLGYAEVSKLVQASVAARRPFIELAIERGLLTHGEVLDALRESTRYGDQAA